MKTLRVLQTFYYTPLDKVFNFNDELQLDNQKMIDNLIKQELVDVLVEEKIEEKEKPKRTQKNKRNTKETTGEE